MAESAASALLEIVHLLVDVVVVFAATIAADLGDHTRHDILVMLLRVVEAVEVADRNSDDEHEHELEHGWRSMRVCS
jgi:hypothetical protein